MAEQYYISSNKYSLRERKVKNGKTVFDVRFRVLTIDGDEVQKCLSGYTSKTLAKQGYLDFLKRRTVVRNGFTPKVC